MSDEVTSSLTIDDIKSIQRHGEADAGELRQLLDAAACLAVMEQQRMCFATMPDETVMVVGGREQFARGPSLLDAVRDWCDRNGVPWPTGDNPNG